MAEPTKGEVGYCKPPVQHQFPKGKSGNPRGRPVGAKGLKSELLAEIGEWVTITVNGKPKRVRMLRVIVKALATKAAKGNVAAADKLLKLVVQAFGFEDEREEKHRLSDADRQILEHFLSDEEAPIATSEGNGQDAAPPPSSSSTKPDSPGADEA